MLISDILPENESSRTRTVPVTDVSPYSTTINVSRKLNVKPESQARLLFYSNLSSADPSVKPKGASGTVERGIRRFSSDLSNSIISDKRLTRYSRVEDYVQPEAVPLGRLASLYKEHLTALKIKRLRSKVKSQPFNT